jgi:hypothetical protein
MASSVVSPERSAQALTGDLHDSAVRKQRPRVESKDQLPVVGECVDRGLGGVVRPGDFAVVESVSGRLDGVWQRTEIRVSLGYTHRRSVLVAAVIRRLR